MPINGLKSAGELAENKPHGLRIKYMGGCRCLPCRAANSNYEKEKRRKRERGEGNGLVSAHKAQNHIADLLKLNIGLRTIRDFSGVGRSILQKIRNGERKQIRAKTERRVLMITEEVLDFLPSRRKTTNKSK